MSYNYCAYVGSRWLTFFFLREPRFALASWLLRIIFINVVYAVIIVDEVFIMYILVII